VTTRSALLVQTNSTTVNATFLVFTAGPDEVVLWKHTDITPVSGTAKNAWWYITDPAGLNAAMLVKSVLGMAVDTVYSDDQWRVIPPNGEVRLYQTVRCQMTMYGARLPYP